MKTLRNEIRDRNLRISWRPVLEDVVSVPIPFLLLSCFRDGSDVLVEDYLRLFDLPGVKDCAWDSVTMLSKPRDFITIREVGEYSKGMDTFVFYAKGGFKFVRGGDFNRGRGRG
jgi:hypothetical protein